MQTGFGKASLWGTFRTQFSQADELDVCAMVCESANCRAALIVTDFLSFWPQTALRLGAEVASHLNIPIQNVGVFTTQNHGVRSGNNDTLYHMPAMKSAFMSAVDQAVQSMQPVEIARISSTPNPTINICRRFELPDLGAFTFWFGYRDLPNGGTDANHLVRLALDDLRQGKPIPRQSYHVALNDKYSAPVSPMAIDEPLLAKPAVDPLVQGLFFRSTVDHRPVGSILRLATHPVCSNRQGEKYHSGDYPAYARRRLEESFGGRALFLTGPCGDSVPRVGRKSIEFAKKIGNEVADCALAELAGAKWSGGLLACESPLVHLPVRTDFPQSPERAKSEAADLAAKIKQLAIANAPLREIKPLCDRYEFLTYASELSFNEWIGLDPFTTKLVAHQLFILRLGENVIAGVPGEPFNNFSVRLRKQTIGDKLLVAEEANGYLSYIPSAQAFAQGSYEPNASIFSADVEDILLDASARAVDRIIK